MTLVLDARLEHRGTKEPVRLKFWENGEAVLRRLRDTPIGQVEVGQPWVCPLWLLDAVYETKEAR